MQGLRTTALSSHRFAPQIFKLGQALNPLHPQPACYPAFLLPWQAQPGPMISVWRAGWRSSRAAAMAQRPPLGCWSHSGLGAWLSQMCCSCIVGLAPVSQSHSENLSGGHSRGPALFLCLPFPVPLPPLRVPKCETLPFCPPVGTPSTSYQPS